MQQLQGFEPEVELIGSESLKIGLTSARIAIAVRRDAIVPNQCTDKTPSRDSRFPLTGALGETSEDGSRLGRYRI